MMTRALSFGQLLASLVLTSFAGASVCAAEPWSQNPAYLVKVGLDAADPVPLTAVPETKPCEGATFSRNLRYGASEQNVLDVATGSAGTGAATPRPVLLFVAGESFSADNAAPDPHSPMQDAAMCFAARHGMVGVRMSYRLAPANPWPSGAKDVAAAASWLHQNVDLFGGNRNEIVAVGYSVGAFHVASLLAHPEFQITDSDVAAAVLVSGIYHTSADAGAEEKSYFGADASQYDQRSAFPGILNIGTPLLLAWSTQDPPRLVAEGETLKQRLCNSITHCPRTTELGYRESLASMFEAPGGGLAQPTLELVREIEARGLP
jgi:acetyl esterase/lipase